MNATNPWTGRDEHTAIGQSPGTSAPLSRASNDCIALLLRLSFDREEIAEMLGALSGDSGAAALRLGSQYRRLSQLVHEDQRAAIALDQALAERLESGAKPLRSCPLVTLATLWAKTRDKSDGLTGAALLWTVARESRPCWRKLEAVMVEDLNYLAARSLSRNTAPPAQEQAA